MRVEDRQKVCQHVLRKLASYYPNAPEEALRQRTVAFERRVFMSATTRAEYLRHIAEGLTNVERQMASANNSNRNNNNAELAASTSPPNVDTANANPSSSGTRQQHVSQAVSNARPRASGVEAGAAAATAAAYAPPTQQPKGGSEPQRDSHVAVVAKAMADAAEAAINQNFFAGAPARSSTPPHASNHPARRSSGEPSTSSRGDRGRARGRAGSTARGGGVAGRGSAGAAATSTAAAALAAAGVNGGSVLSGGGGKRLPQHLRDALTRASGRQAAQNQRLDGSSPSEQARPPEYEVMPPVQSIQDPSATEADGAAGAAVPEGETLSQDELFWQRLGEMQRQYRKPLEKLMPYIQWLQARQTPPERREQFMRQLRDCTNILNMNRMPSLPPRLTPELLDRAARFIHQVVQVYSEWVFQDQNNGGARDSGASDGATAPDANARIGLPAADNDGDGDAERPVAAGPAGSFERTGTEHSMGGGSQTGSKRKSAPRGRAKGAGSFGGGTRGRAKKVKTTSAATSLSGPACDSASKIPQAGIRDEGHSTAAAASSHPQPQQVGAGAGAIVPGDGGKARSVPERVFSMENEVNRAVEFATKLERRVEREIGRLKVERVNNTLQSIRRDQAMAVDSAMCWRGKSLNGGDGVAESRTVSEAERGRRAAIGLTNCTSDPRVHAIQATPVFESRSEGGVRLAKNCCSSGEVGGCARDGLERGAGNGEALMVEVARDHAARMRTIADEVRAVVAKHSREVLRVRVGEVFGMPLIRVDAYGSGELSVPSVTFRVPKSYPHRGRIVTDYGSPPLGWTDALGKLRASFEREVESLPAPVGSVALSVMIDAWVLQVENACRVRYVELQRLAGNGASATVVAASQGGGAGRAATEEGEKNAAQEPGSPKDKEEGQRVWNNNSSKQHAERAVDASSSPSSGGGGGAPWNDMFATGAESHISSVLDPQDDSEAAHRVRSPQPNGAKGVGDGEGSRTKLLSSVTQAPP